MNPRFVIIDVSGRSKVASLMKPDGSKTLRFFRVAKFAGLVWTQHQSGEFEAEHSRMMKSGNRLYIPPEG